MFSSIQASEFLFSSEKLKVPDALARFRRAAPDSSCNAQRGKIEISYILKKEGMFAAKWTLGPLWSHFGNPEFTQLSSKLKFAQSPFEFTHSSS